MISKGAQRRYFTKQTLVTAMSFLINKCFFTIGNMIFKQDVGIPMNIDPALIWANIYLSFIESKYIKKLILNGSSKVYKHHGVSRFINDLLTMVKSP